MTRTRWIGFTLAGAVILGAAAVGGHAWWKYVNRTECGEALGGLRAIGDGAVSWYWGAPAEGEAARRRLPAAVGPTPDHWPQCRDGEPLPADTWSHPSWQALGFAPTGRVYYRYAFIPHPPDEPPGFTVRAFGDLDCDGITSTFERTMVLDGDHFTSAAGPKVVRRDE